MLAFVQQLLTIVAITQLVPHSTSKSEHPEHGVNQFKCFVVVIIPRQLTTESVEHAGALFVDGRHGLLEVGDAGAPLPADGAGVVVAREPPQLDVGRPGPFADLAPKRVHMGQ